MPLLTSGDIARQIGVDRDRVVYLLRARGIKPVGQAGGYRLFDPEAAKVIEREIERMDAKRIASELGATR